jgi:hypothetical protein
MVLKGLFDNFEQVFSITMQVLMKILCVIDFLILFSVAQAFQGKI